MSNLVEQTARFLSGNRPSVQEKSLSDAEIEDLLDKGKEVATSISNDTKKSDEERETARDVLSWIRDVRKTWNKVNSLHPNAVTKLMKITAIRQGKWGWSVPCVGHRNLQAIGQMDRASGDIEVCGHLCRWCVCPHRWW